MNATTVRWCRARLRALKRAALRAVGTADEQRAVQRLIDAKRLELDLDSNGHPREREGDKR